MSCKDTRALLDGYVDGELDLVRSLEIERHLQECVACSQVYKGRQTLRRAINGGSLYFNPPANLQRHVRSVVRKASKAEGTAPGSSWRWIMIAASLALIAIIAWSLIHLVSVPSADELLTQEVISSHVRSLMADHLSDVPSSDSHTVKPWFSGKLDFSPPVRDLSSQGFALVGGRLDYLEKRSVVALVYQRRQHFINLFIWPSMSDSSSGEKMLTRQGYNLTHWTSSGMTYWAVSDLNNSELEVFVRAVKSGG